MPPVEKRKSAFEDSEPRDVSEVGTDHFKDEVLDTLAQRTNVAQFVSFDPGLGQRYCRIRGFAPNHHFPNAEAAVAALLAASPDHSVNVRSYQPHASKSREFLYDKTDVGVVLGELRRLSSEGLFTIVNERIDIHDGGVSGVALGDLVEFSPDDTPRCVERGGTTELPRHEAMRLLETVYGFAPDLLTDCETRVEFSIHPVCRGWRNAHTIIWEAEMALQLPQPAEADWPNRFSRHIGDKAFGLLIAHTFDLPVPNTIVVSRRVAPFCFGTPTGSHERYIRTCPSEQLPGKLTTRLGWLDPFRLLHDEDPEGNLIASILCQDSVQPAYSGALIVQRDGDPLLEGVAGRGEAFMQGCAPPEPLPTGIRRDVLDVWEAASSRLGPVRLEWVHDGSRVWVVQLHHGATETLGKVIYPGQPERFHELNISQGIEALRLLIEQVRGTGEGIVLIGTVGITSHLGDLLRRARIPSLIRDT